MRRRRRYNINILLYYICVQWWRMYNYYIMYIYSLNYYTVALPVWRRWWWWWWRWWQCHIIRGWHRTVVHIQQSLLHEFRIPRPPPAVRFVVRIGEKISINNEFISLFSFWTTRIYMYNDVDIFISWYCRIQSDRSKINNVYKCIISYV